MKKKDTKQLKIAEIKDAKEWTHCNNQANYLVKLEGKTKFVCQAHLNILKADAIKFGKEIIREKILLKWADCQYRREV